MKIGLYDVDSKIPNLALMKLSRFYKEKGDDVEFYMPLLKDNYDRIYASKIFNFSDSSNLFPNKMIIGGTGVDMSINLPAEIERLQPDYSIYKYPNSIGFTMRGCRFKCKFCVVPEKEGAPKPNNTIDEIWTQRDSDFIVLLDNDFFGNELWEDRCKEILKYDLRVNFNQGLNIRIITDKQCEYLYKMKFRNFKGNRKMLHFAWDKFQDGRWVKNGVDRVLKTGIKSYQMTFYVLIGFDTTPEQDLDRVTIIKNWGANPFVMPYDKFDQYQNRFARWVNHKAIFNSVSWEEFRST